ncbi:MAG: hypothetical protein ACKVZ6_06230 [Kineosporiaceae bacterium]|jgi:hypothetical protein
MSDHTPQHARETADGSPASTSSTSRGRRAVIAAGATAAVGAVGVVLAKPADAAAGSSLILGRSNTSGGSTTTVASTNTNSTFKVTATGGTGVLGESTSNVKWGIHGRNVSALPGSHGGVRAEGRANHGLRGDTTSADRAGVWAINAAPTAGDGAAVIADGGSNPAVFARNASSSFDAPTLVAFSGDGAGGPSWASLAIGDSVVFGISSADDSFVAVRALPDPELVPVASGEAALHTKIGSVTLDGTGAATVGFGDAFLLAADAGNPMIALTPVNVAMPNLHVKWTTGNATFQIAGGTPSGTVQYSVTAARKPLPGAAPAALMSAGSKSAPARMKVRPYTVPPK